MTGPLPERIVAEVGIAVLGPLTVDDSGTLGRRDRIILEALVARSGRPVTPDQLADAVWGERPPASAAKNIQGCIVRLRKLLGQDAIVTSPHGYRLALPAEEVDAQRFERSVDRSRELLLLGEPDRAAFQLTEALALWRGEPFSALEGWSGAESEVRCLQELRLDAEELRVEALIGAGRHREVLAEAQALVGAAPLRERRWALLAHAQYLVGRQGDALRTIHQLRSVLSEHLGIDPGPDVVALEAAILRQDDSLLGSRAPAEARATCPYQGLLAYELDDVERFFGRESDVESCLRVLRRTSFLALVGPSGSGKSSLLRAGLAAALRDAGRSSRVITPGRHPLRSLTALAGTPTATALLVDQFEEVFTLCDDPAERAAFIHELVSELDTRTVVIALRSDRLADLAAHPDLGRHVEEGLHLVAGLGEEGLRQAVEAPARQAGLHLEPGLVDLLVREVEGDPGALPLFSHALLETWKRREGNTLTVDGYRATGGIHGAVAQSAEHLYAQTDREHRPLLRDLVLRLVSPGPEGEPVRTRVPRRLIAADRDHDQMVDALVAARLVTSDDGSLEITHEALARAWPRLRSWLDDDVEGQRLLHHLSGAADAWDSLGRPDSELYRGVRLVRALDWRARTSSTLTDTEREFLDRARAVAEVEEQTAAERARSQARLIRRLRIVLGGAVVLLVLAIVAGWVAAGQSNRAGRIAAEARVAAQAAHAAGVAKDARQVGARSASTGEVSLSLLFAAAGARLDDSPDTRANLLTALSMRPQLVRSAPPEGGFMEMLRVSPDGRWIAASDDQDRMHLYDADTLRRIDSYVADTPPEGEQGYMFAAFSPDNRALAVALEGPQSTDPVRILDPRTMERTTPLRFPGGPLSAGDVEFSADGRHLAATVFPPGRSCCPSGATERHGYALVWDLRAPDRAPERIPTGIGNQGMALSPDGRTVYTGWPLTAYDVASGARVWRRARVHTNFTTPEVNRAGTLLALSAGSNDVLLVDARTGRTVRRLDGHRDVVGEVRFSPDGSRVASISGDGELIVWDPSTGRSLHRWDTADPYGVGFGPDNDVVHGGGAQSMLRTWDLSGQETYLEQATHVTGTDSYAWAHVSPEGRRVAYRWVDDHGRGWVRFVETTSGRVSSPARLWALQDWPWTPGAWGPENDEYVGYCCDDQRLAGAGTLRVLRATTGRRLAEETALAGKADLTMVAYAEGGRSLLVSDTEGTTTIVDADSFEPRGVLDVRATLATPIGDGTTAMLFAVSPVVGGGMFWSLVDVRAGEVTTEGVLDHRVYASAASPDGRTVAAAGETGEVVTIDVASGAQRRSLSLGAEVVSIGYSDDGTLLVVGAADGGVSLWDATTLDLLGTVHPAHPGQPVPSAAQFIGETHDVAIASYDGTVYRWDTSLERALDFACQMAGRDLTKEEWQQVLPAQPYQSVCPQG